jgi:nitrogen regulatory protein PII
VVTVSIKQQSGTFTAAVTDVTGKTIQQHTLVGGNSTISLSLLQPGMYYLVVADTNGNKWVEKITKL